MLYRSSPIPANRKMNILCFITGTMTLILSSIHRRKYSGRVMEIVLGKIVYGVNVFY